MSLLWYGKSLSMHFPCHLLSFFLCRSRTRAWGNALTRNWYLWIVFSSPCSRFSRMSFWVIVALKQLRRTKKEGKKNNWLCACAWSHKITHNTSWADCRHWGTESSPVSLSISLSLSFSLLISVLLFCRLEHGLLGTLV